MKGVVINFIKLIVIEYGCDSIWVNVIVLGIIEILLVDKLIGMSEDDVGKIFREN